MKVSKIAMKSFQTKEKGYKGLLVKRDARMNKVKKKIV